MADRSDFLISMYEQMFRDIAQQYTVVWQSAATVFASFAIVAFVEKGLVPIDLAVAIIVLVLTWFLLNVIECSYWYNRNLCIIANIERQFLLKGDLHDIQYYFGAHRPMNKMTSHLQNQAFLGFGLSILMLLYHFFTRVAPGFSLPIDDFNVVLGLPYVAAGVCAYYLNRRSGLRRTAYEEFVSNSPGIAIDASSVTYGVGHGHKPS